MLTKELCASFLENTSQYGWKAYPRVGDWDLLLVKDSWQIGIQSSLTYNLQALERIVQVSHPQHQEGPDFRALLLPDAVRYKAALICSPLRIWSFSDHHLGHGLLAWPDIDERMLKLTKQFRWTPVQRHTLPEQVTAETPPSTALTAWKQKALQLLALAQVRGYVTGVDARKLGLNIRTFIKMRWLIPCGIHIRNIKRYQLGIADNSPHIRHPVEYQIHVQAQTELFRQGACTDPEDIRCIEAESQH